MSSTSSEKSQNVPPPPPPLIENPFTSAPAVTNPFRNQSSLRDIIYSVDRDFTILSMMKFPVYDEELYRSFVGRNLFDFLSGEDMKVTYRKFLRTLFTGIKESIGFSWYCHEAGVERYIYMVMYTNPGREVVWFRSMTLKEIKSQDFFSFARKPNDRIIQICSYCNRILWEGNEQNNSGENKLDQSLSSNNPTPSQNDQPPKKKWLTPTDYYQQGGTNEICPSHVVCEDCYTEVDLLIAGDQSQSVPQDPQQDDSSLPSKKKRREDTGQDEQLKKIPKIVPTPTSRPRSSSISSESSDINSSETSISISIERFTRHRRPSFSRTLRHSLLSLEPTTFVHLQNKQINILVTDDDPLQRRILQGILKNSKDIKYVVQTAKDGEEAVQIVENNFKTSTPKPLLPCCGTDRCNCFGASQAGHLSFHNNNIDVVLMDIMMPGITGIQASQIIRNKGYQGIIIAVTGLADNGQCLQECFQVGGMDDFLPKPLKSVELLSLLTKWIVALNSVVFTSQWVDFLTDENNDAHCFLAPDSFDLSTRPHTGTTPPLSHTNNLESNPVQDDLLAPSTTSNTSDLQFDGENNTESKGPQEIDHLNFFKENSTEQQIAPPPIDFVVSDKLFGS